MADSATRWYSPGECWVCGLAPILFVTSSWDGAVVLYCPDCGGVYLAPDQRDFAYGDRKTDVTVLAPATLGEIESAGFPAIARQVASPTRFP